MSNVKRFMSFIGRTGNVVISGQAGIKFGVTVTDVREVYNSMQFFCEPISGTGGRWYVAGSVELHEVIKGGNDPEVN